MSLSTSPEHDVLHVDVDTLNFGGIQCTKSVDEETNQRHLHVVDDSGSGTQASICRTLKITNVSQERGVKFQAFSTTPSRYKVTPKNVRLPPRASCEVSVEIGLASFRVVGTQAKHFRDYLFLRGGNFSEKKITIRGRIVPLRTVSQTSSQPTAKSPDDQSDRRLETPDTRRVASLEEENNELREQNRLLYNRVQQLTQSLSALSADARESPQQSEVASLSSEETDKPSAEDKCDRCSLLRNLLNSQEAEIHALVRSVESWSVRGVREEGNDEGGDTRSEELLEVKEQIEILQENITNHQPDSDSAKVSLRKSTVETLCSGFINWCGELERRWSLQQHAAVTSSVLRSLREVVSFQREALFRLHHSIVNSIETTKKTQVVAELTDERLLHLLSFVGVDNAAQGSARSVHEENRTFNAQGNNRGVDSPTVSQLNDFALSESACVAAVHRNQHLMGMLQQFSGEAISTYQNMRSQLTELCRDLKSSRGSAPSSESSTENFSPQLFSQIKNEVKAIVSRTLPNWSTRKTHRSSVKEEKDAKAGKSLSAKQTNVWRGDGHVQNRFFEWLNRLMKKAYVSNIAESVDYEKLLQAVRDISNLQQNSTSSQDGEEYYCWAEGFMKQILGDGGLRWSPERLRDFLAKTMQAMVETLQSEVAVKELYAQIGNLNFGKPFEHDYALENVRQACQLHLAEGESTSMSFSELYTSRVGLLDAVLQEYAALQNESARQTLQNSAERCISLLESARNNQDVELPEVGGDFCAEPMSAMQTQLKELTQQVQNEKNVRVQVENYYQNIVNSLRDRISTEQQRKYELQECLRSRDEQLNSLTDTIQKIQDSNSMENVYALRHLREHVLKLTSVSLKWQTLASVLQRRLRRSVRSFNDVATEHPKSTDSMAKVGVNQNHSSPVHSDQEGTSCYGKTRLYSIIEGFRKESESWRNRMETFLKESHAYLNTHLETFSASEEDSLIDMIHFFYRYCIQLEKRCLTIEKESVDTHFYLSEAVLRRDTLHSQRASENSIRQELETIKSDIKTWKIRNVPTSMRQSRRHASIPDRRTTPALVDRIQNFLSEKEANTSRDLLLTKFTAREMANLCDRLEEEHEEHLSAFDESAKTSTQNAGIAGDVLQDMERRIDYLLSAVLPEPNQKPTSHRDSIVASWADKLDSKLEVTYTNMEQQFPPSIWRNLLRRISSSRSTTTSTKQQKSASTQTNPDSTRSRPIAVASQAAEDQIEDSPRDSFLTASSIGNLDASMFREQAKRLLKDEQEGVLECDSPSTFKLSATFLFRLLAEIENAQRQMQQAYRSEASTLKRLNACIREGSESKISPSSDTGIPYNELLRENRILRSYVHSLTRQAHEEFSRCFPELSGYSSCFEQLIELYRSLASKQRQMHLLQEMLKRQTDKVHRLTANQKSGRQSLPSCNCLSAHGPGRYSLRFPDKRKERQMTPSIRVIPRVLVEQISPAILGHSRIPRNTLSKCTNTQGIAILPKSAIVNQEQLSSTEIGGFAPLGGRASAYDAVTTGDADYWPATPSKPFSNTLSTTEAYEHRTTHPCSQQNQLSGNFRLTTISGRSSSRIAPVSPGGCSSNDGTEVPRRVISVTDLPECRRSETSADSNIQNHGYASEARSFTTTHSSPTIVSSEVVSSVSRSSPVPKGTDIPANASSSIQGTFNHILWTTAANNAHSGSTFFDTEETDDSSPIAMAENTSNTPAFFIDQSTADKRDCNTLTSAIGGEDSTYCTLQAQRTLQMSISTKQFIPASGTEPERQLHLGYHADECRLEGTHDEQFLERKLSSVSYSVLGRSGEDHAQTNSSEGSTSLESVSLGALSQESIPEEEQSNVKSAAQIDTGVEISDSWLHPSLASAEYKEPSAVSFATTSTLLTRSGQSSKDDDFSNTISESPHVEQEYLQSSPGDSVLAATRYSRCASENISIAQSDWLDENSARRQNLRPIDSSSLNKNDNVGDRRSTQAVHAFTDSIPGSQHAVEHQTVSQLVSSSSLNYFPEEHSPTNSGETLRGAGHGQLYELKENDASINASNYTKAYSLQRQYQSTEHSCSTKNHATAEPRSKALEIVEPELHTQFENQLEFNRRDPNSTKDGGRHRTPGMRSTETQPTTVVVERRKQGSDNVNSVNREEDYLSQSVSITGPKQDVCMKNDGNVQRSTAPSTSFSRQMIVTVIRPSTVSTETNPRPTASLASGGSATSRSEIPNPGEYADPLSLQKGIAASGVILDNNEQDLWQRTGPYAAARYSPIQAARKSRGCDADLDFCSPVATMEISPHSLVQVPTLNRIELSDPSVHQSRVSGVVSESVSSCERSVLSCAFRLCSHDLSALDRSKTGLSVATPFSSRAHDQYAGFSPVRLGKPGRLQSVRSVRTQTDSSSSVAPLLLQSRCIWSSIEPCQSHSSVSVRVSLHYLSSCFLRLHRRLHLSHYLNKWRLRSQGCTTGSVQRGGVPCNQESGVLLSDRFRRIKQPSNRTARNLSRARNGTPYARRHRSKDSRSPSRTRSRVESVTNQGGRNWRNTSRCVHRYFSQPRSQPQYELSWFCANPSCKRRRHELVRSRKLLRVYLNRVALLRRLVQHDDNFALVKELLAEGIRPNSKHETNILYSFLIKALRQLFGVMGDKSCSLPTEWLNMQPFLKVVLNAVQNLKQNILSRKRYIEKQTRRIKNLKRLLKAKQTKLDQAESQLSNDRKVHQKEIRGLKRRAPTERALYKTHNQAVNTDTRVEDTNEVMSLLARILENTIEKNKIAQHELARLGGPRLAGISEDYNARAQDLQSIINDGYESKHRLREAVRAIDLAVTDGKKIEYALGISTAVGV